MAEWSREMKMNFQSIDIGKLPGAKFLKIVLSQSRRIRDDESILAVKSKD